MINNIYKMDQYFLSDDSSKFLMAQHFHSSLNEPNLDNVEAKLYATRQRNHELAMQYFKNKYGNTQIYEQISKTHNLGQVHNKASQADDLKMHLQRKARQIQRRQRQKIQKGQFIEESDEPEQSFDFKTGKAKYKSKQKHTKNNPWVQKSNNKHQKNKQSSFSKNEDDIIVDSINNQQKYKEGEFINEFKSYLINKSKFVKEDNFNQNQDQIIMSSSPFKNSQNFAESKYISKAELEKKPKQQQAKIHRNYEEQLTKKIFRDIIGQNRDNSKVEKLVLIEYLVKNKKILKVLNLDEQSLSRTLLSEYQTGHETEITFQEFLFYILKIVGKEDQINQIIQEKREKKIPDGCVLEKATIIHFQQIFKQLDRHTDLIVRRLEFTQRLANDSIIKKILDQPAVYQEELDKLVSLRRILERIQLEAILGSEEEIKVKQYVSWNQFLNYFKSGAHARGKYDLLLLVDSLKHEQKFGLFQLPDIVMEIIVWAIQKQDKGREYFNVYSLIQQISKHPEFDHEKYGLARQQSKISNLPAETFEEVLSRIKGSAPKFLSIKEFFEYFSARGRLMEEMNKQKNDNLSKNFSRVKVKFAKQQFANKDHIDGYDSDPQMYSSQVANSPRRTARSSKKLLGPSSRNPLTDSLQKQQIEIMKKQFKVTVPVPFSFEQRQKNKFKKQLTTNSQKQIQQFKAKAVPPKVKDKGLYERMLNQESKKIEQRKKNNMIITLANQRPFSFMQRKTNKKTRQQRQEFKFRAKPIPWFCSVDLLEKKKQSQLVRNEKIAKEAQQSLAKAKFPPRMQRDYQQKMAKKAQQPNVVNKKQKKNSSYRDPPDFDRIHRQFQEGLERKRKQNKVTQPQQFNFTKRPQSKEKMVFNYATQLSNFSENIKTGENYKKHLEPKAAANSTLKFTQQVEKRRKQMEQKRLKEQKKREQDQQRAKIKDEELKKRINALAKKQNKEKQERQKRQKEMEDQRIRHLQWKKQRIQKGRQQPMLIDRALKRDEKIEKMKKLSQISKTLKQNGIKGKDHDSYFKKEQLLLLQDWEQLKDKIK